MNKVVYTLEAIRLQVMLIFWSSIRSVPF